MSHILILFSSFFFWIIPFDEFLAGLLICATEVYWAGEEHQIGKANSSMELRGERRSLDQQGRAVKRNACTWKGARNKSHWLERRAAFVLQRCDRDASFNAARRVVSVTLYLSHQQRLVLKRARWMFFSWTLISSALLLVDFGCRCLFKCSCICFYAVHDEFRAWVNLRYWT